jgi:hypothetical protein
MKPSEARVAKALHRKAAFMALPASVVHTAIHTKAGHLPPAPSAQCPPPLTKLLLTHLHALHTLHPKALLWVLILAHLCDGSGMQRSVKSKSWD